MSNPLNFGPRARVLATVLALASATGVSGEIIGINFEGGQMNPCCGGGGTAKVTGTAGFTPSANWNNFPGNSGTGLALVDENGVPTGVTLTYAVGNNWAATNAAPGDGANGDLMSGYLDNFGGNSLTITGLGPGYIANGYDVIVYFNADSAGTQGYTLGGVTRYGRQAGGAGSNYPLAGGTNGYVLSTGTTYAGAPVANGVRFSGLTASGFTLTGAAGDGGDRARPNGIQIIGTAVPGLPTVRADPATGVSAAAATLRGTVTALGSGAPSVTFFHGPSDGGLVAGNWAASVALAGTQTGPFFEAVGGLTPATVYFYRARAINASGTAWTTTAGSFETLPAPPAVTNLAASDVGATHATVGAQVTETGGDTPTVTLHYGTVDGGTGVWQQSVGLGNVAASAIATLTGLSQGTPYYYRAFASNGGGSAWAAASGTFTTTTVSLPSVVNDAPTGVTGTSATLRGEVTGTGFEPPVVTVRYGTTDGGTTPGAWQKSVVLGARAGAFSTFAGGLTPETAYFVRASATNSAGTVWAPSSLAFSTTALVPNSVVINEIHYDPAGVDPEEFVELHNPGDLPIDVSGWKLKGGVDYTFPGGTLIAAGGYRVIAADPATIQANYIVGALGPFLGKLSNSGERLELDDAGGAPVDRVDYGVGFPWPTASRGAGSSMELMHPGLDNDLGGSWRASGAAVTPPTPQVFIPAESPGWRYRRGTNEPSSPQSAWRALDFVEDATWIPAPLGTPIGFADNDDNTLVTGMQSVHWSLYLRQTFTVDALDVPSSLLLRVYVDDGCVVWINGTEVGRFNFPGGPTNFDTPAINHEAAWEEIVLNNAGAFLIGGTNVIAVQAANASLGSSDFSIDVELKTPTGVNLTGTPTPGAPNSVFTTRVPPQVRQVAHLPAQPAAGQEVVVSARVTDPEGVASVLLAYQTVAPGSYIRKHDAAYENPANWTSLALHDDGLAGDAVPGDSTYSVIIPAGVQANRALVRYRLTVADANGITQRVPYEDDEQPNFAYFVHNGAPAWTGANQPGVTGTVVFPATLMDDLATYHLVANGTDVNNSQFSGGSDGVHMRGTMVYDGIVYDHIAFENRGEASTYQAGKNKWRFHFNRARDFEARDNWGRKYASPFDEMNFDACASPWAPVHRGMAGVEEAVSYRMYALAGAPSPRTHYVHFRVVDAAAEAPADQYAGDLWGLYLSVEHPDGSFLDDRGLPDGNVYKIEGGAGDKKHQGKTQPLNSSDWDAFRNASGGTQNEAYWRANMNLSAYYTFRACNRINGNVDVREGYNHYFYHDPVNGWTVLPWDLDMMFIAETHWSGTIQQKACLNVPVLAVEYRNRARELLDLLCGDPSPAGGQIAQLVDEYAQLVNPPGQALTWSDLDQYLWNYHPRTNGNPNDHSGQGNHKGNFFYTPFTDARIGGNYVRTLVSSDHEGSMAYLRDYATNTFGGGAWTPGNGRQSGYGHEFLKSDAADAAIPGKPVIAYAGAPGFATDDLDFTTSVFADPQGAGTFSSLMWRVGEISNPTTPLYDPAGPYVYEVEERWNSGEISAFSPTYTIPPGAVRVGHTYRARVKYKDNTGRWSHWSAPVQFVAGEPDLTPWINDLVITEVMYHPSDPTPDEINAGFTGSDFEYVELQNVGATTLDLGELRFTKGINFDFAGGAVTSLAPGAYALVVRNIAAFESRHGTGLPVAGAYDPDNLSNGGDRVKLSFGLGSRIHEFLYDDEAPWPEAADGTGASMVLVRPASSPRPDHALPASWRASSDGGNPGTTDATMFAGDPEANADGDSLNALLEYAFGTSDGDGSDAGAAYTAGLASFGGTGHFALTYRRSLAAEDVTLAVEKSPDLDAWGTDESLVLESDVPQGDGTSLVTWRVAAPVTGAERGFLRIVAILHP